MNRAKSMEIFHSKINAEIAVVCDVNLDVWSMGMSMKVCAAVLFF